MTVEVDRNGTLLDKQNSRSIQRWVVHSGLLALSIILALSPGFSPPARANPQLALVEGARANMELLPTQEVKSEKFDYPHAVTIALPASYRVESDRTYPVLWVLDDPLMTRMVVGVLDTLVMGNHAPEMIVIGVGSPAKDGLTGVGRRISEFSPPGDTQYWTDTIGGRAFAEEVPLKDFPHRADDFQSFLIDELRPKLASRFRFSGEHALQAHSAGGMFAAYSLFTRPEAFSKMILGSPYVAGNEGAIFNVEETFSETHDALPVSLYIGAGGAELDEWFLATSSIVGGTAQFVERLHSRAYRGMNLKSRIYDGEDHYTVAPRVIVDGIRHLWAEEAKELGSSWPTRPKP